MIRRGKHYRSVREKVERKVYPLADAIEIIKANPMAKFDETIDISFRLGVDFKKSDQTVRSTVSLPHGTGKQVRVLVFASGEAAEAARAAGADYAGSDDLIEKIQSGWTDFDVAIATTAAMKDVRKLGKVLGPRGLMPNPKTGTVTDDLPAAVKQFKGGRIEFRMDRHGNVALSFGRRSFETANLVENANAAVDALMKSKPASSKGAFIRRCVVSSTMGVGLQVNIVDKEAVEA